MSRYVDILLAFILLVPTLLVIGFLMCLTIVIDRISPVFKIKRMGKGGATFTVYKLQTMKPPKNEKELYDTEIIKKRLTRLGSIYRDHGWDELLQIINILTGQMSFIRPRPLSEKKLKALKVKFPNKFNLIETWIKERKKVKPVITGWHQIHLKDRDIIKRDMQYLKNPSLSKKTQILTVSLLITLLGKSRYFGEEFPIVYEHEIN